MPRRRVASRRRGTGQRRKLVWARRNSAVVTSGTGNVLDLLTVFETELGADLIGSTIRRVILDLTFEIATLGTTTDHVRHGLIVADSDFNTALLAGGLLGAPHRDWFWYGISAPTDTAPVIGTQWHYHADVRVGRKFDEVNEDAFLVLEGAVDGVYNTTLTSSLLIALS